MTAPVTRGGLGEVLAAYPTRVELKEMLSAYPTRVDLKAELEKFKIELKTELTTELKTELGQEIARQMRAGCEEMRMQFGVLDDKSHAQSDKHRSLARRVGVL